MLWIMDFVVTFILTFLFVSSWRNIFLYCLITVVFYSAAIINACFLKLWKFVGIYKHCSHRLCFPELSELRAVHMFMQRPQGRGAGNTSLSAVRVPVRN